MNDSDVKVAAGQVWRLTSDRFKVVEKRKWAVITEEFQDDRDFVFAFEYRPPIPQPEGYAYGDINSNEALTGFFSDNGEFAGWDKDILLQKGCPECARATELTFFDHLLTCSECDEVFRLVDTSEEDSVCQKQPACTH